MTVLDERLRVSGIGLAVVAAAIGVMLATTIALSRATRPRCNPRRSPSRTEGECLPAARTLRSCEVKLSTIFLLEAP